MKLYFWLDKVVNTVTSALRKYKQNYEFKIILNYTGSSRTA